MQSDTDIQIYVPEMKLFANYFQRNNVSRRMLKKKMRLRGIRNYIAASQGVDREENEVNFDSRLSSTINNCFQIDGSCFASRKPLRYPLNGYELLMLVSLFIADPCQSIQNNQSAPLPTQRSRRY